MPSATRCFDHGGIDQEFLGISPSSRSLNCHGGQTSAQAVRVILEVHRSSSGSADRLADVSTDAVSADHQAAVPTPPAAPEPELNAPRYATLEHRSAPAGGLPSWEDVVSEHSTRVYRLAYRLTGNKHDAEDLTHDVFLRVFRSLNTYQPGTFEGWLHRITTNLFLDRMRRKQRIRFDALSDEQAARWPSRVPSPERAYADGHFDDDVQQALDALAPDYRAAVVLCDIEGLSYEEIAATLGIKLGTVRSRIHRGRTQLRDALAHRAPTSQRSRATRMPGRAGLSLPRALPSC